MHLEIITPDKKVYSGEVTSVSVPGAAGRFQILKNHAPIISTLLNGKVKIKDASGVHEFDVKGGVVENLKNKVVILAESPLTVIVSRRPPPSINRKTLGPSGRIASASTNFRETCNFVSLPALPSFTSMRNKSAAS